MKNIQKTIVVMMVSEMLAIGTLQADTWWDSGHHTVTENDVYGEIFMQNDATADIFGGTITKLETWDFSIADIYGGEIDWLYADYSSVVNIYGGTLDILGAWADSVVNLYAYDVTYHAIGEGLIEGTYYSDNSQFILTLKTTETYSHVNVVPEPATLLVFVLGALIMRRRN